MKYIIAALFITGCMTTEKATIYLQNKGKLSEVCADKYPPKIEYKQGQTITRTDTAYLPGDSVACPPVVRGKDTVKVFAKCPPHKVIRDTTYRVDTTIVENFARVLDLQYKLGDRDSEILMLKEQIKGKSRLGLIVVILSISLCGVIILRFKRII